MAAVASSRCRNVQVIGIWFSLLLIAVDGGSVGRTRGRRRTLVQHEQAVANNITLDMVGALAELKRCISSDPLRILDSWNVSSSSLNGTSVNPCQQHWAGLTCDPQGSGQIVAINLSNKRLVGTLPPSLSLLPLTSLSSLDLSDNNLSLSSDFSTLSNLIPPSLRLFNLSYNTIASNTPYPLSRLLMNVSSNTLQQLWLDSMKLSGSLPQQLEAVQVGHNFPSLLTLSLSHNTLAGELPAVAEQLRACQSLQHVDVSHNNLSGTLGSWCGGGIGGNLSASLTYLDVSNNKLDGTIPTDLANCSALQHVDLAFNTFRGTLPAALPVSCRKLTYFSVLDCLTLSGPLPPEFSLLSSLQSLLLESNSFFGSPLPILLNCSALQTIHFFGNFFEGPIPADFGTRLPNLQDLVLGNNSFSGTLPPSLANCSFTNLMLGYNQFSGTISGDMLGRWSELHHQIDLQHNGFTGSLPRQIGNLTKLVILILNNNFFSGGIPAEIGLLSSLEGATFEHNAFSGKFPAEIFNCTGLMHLIIHDNHLSGPLPASIGQARKLSYLEAQNNLMSGSLPEALSNCTQLQNFSLGGNQLTGSIPEYLASLHDFLFLFDLSHNNLSGVIPTGFGGMLQMQSLDLSHNQLSGPVPADLPLAVGLLSLNLASNLLEGSIPSVSLDGDRYSSSWPALTLLNLSFNSLSGSIPSGLGGLRSLQELDLSHNQLEGPIPATLSTAPSLAFLDLSYNNLQGMVPDGGGVFRNATAASFLGNPGLCGEIVGRSCSGASLLRGKGAKIGLLTGLIVLVLIVVAAGVLMRMRLARRRKYRKFLLPTSQTSKSSNLMKLQLHQIEAATNNFSMENLIGIGASGSVYKGVMPNGQVLAFKKFSLDSSSLSSFFRELQTVGQVRHRNLIKILGYWSNHRDNNILVLEYMSKGSLEDHLHHIPKEPRSCQLTLEARWNLAVAIAEGLLYLHEECPLSPIIHCDIKPSNILFDVNMQACISDFGIAKVIMDMVTSTQNLHGTLGYMAPECASSGKMSPKCDVYSYGILVLEMLSGRRPTDSMFLEKGVNISQWTKSNLEEGLVVHEILDGTMVSLYDKGVDDDVIRIDLLIDVALECTKESPRERPTMSQVLTRLHGISPPKNHKSKRDL